MFPRARLAEPNVEIVFPPKLYSELVTLNYGSYVLESYIMLMLKTLKLYHY